MPAKGNMRKHPLVMCLTNTVAANFTANALLAFGAKPAMVEEPSEAAELAERADAVLVNLGTVHPRQAETMRSAINALQRLPDSRSNSQPSSNLHPWVLDPVACHLLTYRGKLAEEFVSRKPTLIRGNHAEIEYLMGSCLNKNRESDFDPWHGLFARGGARGRIRAWTIRARCREGC